MIVLRLGFLSGILVLAMAGWSFAKEQSRLNIYAWSGFLPPNIIQQFERETGITCSVDYYDSNEILEAKLLAQNSGYDIVFPTAWPYLARQIEAHIYQPLNLDKIPNLMGADKTILKHLSLADPGNRHAVPFLWGVTGIGYNVKQVRALMPDLPLDSLALLFDPRLVASLSRCGVEVLDEAVDLFAAVLRYHKLNPYSKERHDIQQAENTLRRIRPFITRFDATRAVSDLANGDACLVLHWSNDVALAQAQAKSAGKGVEVQFMIPSEGTSIFIDTAAIPNDAPHVENAHRFLNFLLRPEIIAQVTTLTLSPNAIPASLKFIKDEIKNNPIIYIPLQQWQDIDFHATLSRSHERDLNRRLTRIKTGR